MFVLALAGARFSVVGPEGYGRSRPEESSHPVKIEQLRAISRPPPHARPPEPKGMKKFSILCGLLLACASATVAQSAQTAYRFDNFDTRDGVQIVVPGPPAPAVAPKKRLRLTARGVARTVGPAAATAPRSAAEEIASPALRAPGAETLGMATGESLAGFSTGDARIDSMIVGAGRRHGVDPVLLYAVMHRESSFKRMAVSHKGASGLMQLMPATARRFGVRNIFDPAENIEAGTRYLRWLLNTFDGDVRLALAGYNAGEGAVMKYGWRVPPYRETQEYVRRITERYALIRDPQTARRAPRVTRPQLAKFSKTEHQAAGPLYEREVFAVRTPDGRLMLVTQ
jgi:soluble lytic murein transglycosylase-like protein